MTPANATCPKPAFNTPVALPLRPPPITSVARHARPSRCAPRRCRPSVLHMSAPPPRGEQPADQDGEALIEAAMVGDYAAVCTALANGVSPSYASANGSMTALMWAAAEGHGEIVHRLIDAGADVNARTPQGSSALLYAVENLRSSNPRDPPPPGFPGRDLFSPSKAADVPKQMPVYAKLTAHPSIILHLIEQGADIRIRNEMDETLLHLAARKAQDGVVRELLARGLDVNAKSMGTLETPLHVAAKEAHVDLVNFLCEVGADIEAKNRFGWTPLLWAAASGWGNVVESLIAKGADVNVQATYNAQMTSPLKEARRCSSPVSICNMLIRAGAVE